MSRSQAPTAGMTSLALRRSSCRGWGRSKRSCAPQASPSLAIRRVRRRVTSRRRDQSRRRAGCTLDWPRSRPPVHAAPRAHRLVRAALHRLPAPPRAVKGDRGQAIVEFAMVLPLLLALIVAVVLVAEIGVARLALEHAAAEAARTGALTNDDDLVRATVAAAVTPLDPK